MRLFTTVMLSMLFIVAWLSGCVDVPSNGPTPPTFESEYRFLNADKDLNDVSISFDLGPDVNGLSFMETSSHETYPSGARVGAIENTTDTIRVAVTSEQRATVVLLPRTGTTREFIKLIERRIFDPATLAAADVELPINDTSGVHLSDTTFSDVSVGALRIAHVVPDSVVNIEIVGEEMALNDSVVIENRLEIAGAEYRDITSYQTLLPGNYRITAFSAADSTVLATTQVSVGNTRRTSVAVLSDSGVEFINLEDN